MGLAAIIGVAAGLGVVAFYRLIDLAHRFFADYLGARIDAVAHTITLPVITALGIYAAWLVVRRSGIPDGQNVSDVQLSVAKRGGRVRGRHVAFRTIASALTLGSGGSAGGEGPVAVLGSATGSAIGRWFRFSPRRVKILVGCGAAAGISGAFNAPFAGAFFALEEVLASFSVSAFSPVVVASVVGALVVRPFLGMSPAFELPAQPEGQALTILLLFPLLGVVCGAFSALFSRVFFGAADWARRVPGPAALLPLLGGLLTGLIVVASGGLLVGDGHLAIPSSIFGGLAWYVLIALAVAKILATSLTLQWGGSGGVFTPALFVGAALGGGLGRLAAELLPAWGVNPQTWALVGMGGLVAGAARAPLTAIFMVFELSDDYTLVLPLMLVSVIALAVSRRLTPHGLYDGWLARRGEHLAHGADRALMERLRAIDAIDRRTLTVPARATLEEIVEAAQHTRQPAIPVLDDDGVLLGVITYDELRQVMLDRGELAPVLIAADLAEPVEVSTPADSLRVALRRMNARELDLLPVVENEHSQHYLGTISRADLLTAYERELVHEV